MTLAATASKRAALPAATETTSSQYLTFSLGKEMFAVEILNVKEILLSFTLKLF